MGYFGGLDTGLQGCFLRFLNFSQHSSRFFLIGEWQALGSGVVLQFFGLRVF